MALQSPIAWADFENAVKRWFNHATGLTTIWSGQHGPQPEYPFARLKLISGPIKYGRDDKRRTTDLSKPGEEIEIKVCGVRDVVISCQVFTEDDGPGANAQHYLTIAQSSLELPSVLQSLRESHVAFIDVTSPQDLDFVASGRIKSRAGMEVRFRVPSSLAYRIGYIETAGVEGTYKNPDGSTAVTVEDTYGA